LSFSLDDNTSPPIIIIDIRYHNSGEYILSDSINTSAESAPTPTECNDIFHQKLIIVTITDRKKLAKINDLRKTGIGKRKTIYEVAAYKRVVKRSGIIRSFLFSTDHELIIFLYLKKGNKDSGSKTLLIKMIKNNSLLTVEGRYPKRVGDAKIIAIPNTGISNGWKTADNIFDIVFNISFS
jgi:hypothetical protein